MARMRAAAPTRSGAAQLQENLRSLHVKGLALLPVIVVALVVGALISPAFLTTTNLINILQQASELAVVVIAESLILIVGKFDLSLESTVGLAPMVATWLMLSKTSSGSGLNLNPYLAIVVLLVVGAAIGAINGFFVVRMRLNAFIVTLAMLILLRGITLGITSGQTLYNIPDPFLYLGSAIWLGVPLSVWTAAVLFALVGLVLRYHRFGRAIYAIGGNAEAARAAGIRVERVTWIVFIVGSMLAALAGLMLTGRLASVTTNQGQNMIFTVFAAAVIGGISLNGGRGTMFGALSGVLLLGIIQNILVLSQVQAFWIDASFGAIILLALLLTRVTTGEAQGE